MTTFKVVSVNISKEKGTIKKPVENIQLDKNGCEGDAHSGPWHRQVSLLGTNSFDKFSKQANRSFKYGDFAENITTEGIELYKTKPLDRFISNDIVLEVTQIGKKCHGDGCAIFKEVGNCVMPKEGIFCRVIQGGELVAGHEFEYNPKVFRVLIITLSDRASEGVYTDRSGPRVKKLIEEHFNKIERQFKIDSIVIPDHAKSLEILAQTAKNDKADLIITTGGTGIGPKDITVETLQPMLDKEIPGIMEMIRMKYGAEKPNALLSRGIAGVMGQTLVYTLPGSVKAVNEYMEEICKTLEHLYYMLHGLDAH
jgi:molybdopterin adenylyltransferase